MLNQFLDAMVATTVLLSQSAANTAAATSSWIDTRSCEGLLAFLLNVGAITGSFTPTFEDATSSGGANNAAILPLGGNLGALTQNAQYVALFPATASRGWMKIIGTIATGPTLIGVTLLSLPKSAS